MALRIIDLSLQLLSVYLHTFIIIIQLSICQENSANLVGIFCVYKPNMY